MTDVVLLAILRPTPGSRQALIEVLQSTIDRVHLEPGCEFYAIHEGPDETVYMIEKWESEDALAAHSAGEAAQDFRRLTQGLLSGPAELTRLRAVPAGTSAKGAL